MASVQVHCQSVLMNGPGEVNCNKYYRDNYYAWPVACCMTC